jgi:hypothetical protein
MMRNRTLCLGLLLALGGCDNLADTLDQAIRRHGGEATAARDA